MDKFNDMLLLLDERMKIQDKEWADQEKQLRTIRAAVTTPGEEDIEPITTPLFRHQLDAAIETVTMARRTIHTTQARRRIMAFHLEEIKKFYQDMYSQTPHMTTRDDLRSNIQGFGEAMIDFGRIEKHFDLYQQDLVSRAMCHLPESLLRHIKAEEP